MGLKEAGLRGSLRSVSTGVPDSVVSRPDDDASTTDDRERGLQIETKTEWPSIGARISNNTAGATTAYLREDDGTEIDSLDISNLDTGDAFTFDDVDLEADTKYRIVIDAGGSDYTVGFFGGDTDYPYTSEDVDITSAITDGSTTNSPLTVNDVGDVGFD